MAFSVNFNVLILLITKAQVTPEKDFNWQEFKIKTLGVWFSIEPELTMILNFEEKTEKSSERT